MSNSEINRGPDNQVPAKPDEALTENVQGLQDETPKVEDTEIVNPISEEESLVNLEEPIEENNMAYTVTLKTTEGDIKIELNQDQTPKTVANFVKLAKEGFYDGTIFHRALEGFMIQGGDPEGNGTGGPGYKFDDEPFEGDYSRGTVAMANSGPNTNGSQFFIMHKDYPLPKNYVIFGKVTKGMDAVDKIATAEKTMSPNGEMSKPVNPVSITKTVVEEFAK